MRKGTERLVAIALYWRMAWIESNPDAGIGPFAETVLEQMLKEEALSMTPLKRKNVLKLYELRKSGGRVDHGA